MSKLYVLLSSFREALASAASALLFTFASAGCGSRQALSCPAVASAPPTASASAAPVSAPSIPCADTAATSAMPDAGARSIFDRLGGAGGISAIVDALLARLVSGGRTRAAFAHVAANAGARAHLHDALALQICALSGGGCSFTTEVKSAHSALHVTADQWDAFIEDFTIVLKASAGNLSLDDESALLAALGKYRRDVVTTAVPADF